MGRCPKYLNVDDFDSIAQSLELKLTDDGVSAVGEICEYIAMQIIRQGSQDGNTATLDFDNIISVAKSLGISLELNLETKTVVKANIER
jgi:hypothetical protein